MRSEAMKLVERCMDAYLFDNDLGGASPQAGDAIAGLVWATIEEVVEAGELTEVNAIVEEAMRRAQGEIDDILEAWADDGNEDEDEQEVCDA